MCRKAAVQTVAMLVHNCSDLPLKLRSADGVPTAPASFPCACSALPFG